MLWCSWLRLLHFRVCVLALLPVEVLYVCRWGPLDAGHVLAYRGDVLREQDERVSLQRL